jgi:hypothetical protein
LLQSLLSQSELGGFKKKVFLVANNPMR